MMPLDYVEKKRDKESGERRPYYTTITLIGANFGKARQAMDCPAKVR
jgi:hypothetical protein